MCRLAFSDDNVPYIVPMNFGYEYENGKLTLYFHGAKEGKKLGIIDKNPVASFEMDCSHRLIGADEACNFSMEYESVVGAGGIYICDDKCEKINALKHLMRKYDKDRDFDFPDDALESITVFKLEVSEFSGKRLKKTCDKDVTRV